MPNLPNGAKAPKKKKPAPKRKPSLRATTKKAKATIKKATYQVPKKLLKNTAANKKAGLPSLADVLKKQDKKIAAYNAAKKPKAKPATKAKKSSDWEAGMSVRDWARGQDWYKGKK